VAQIAAPSASGRTLGTLAVPVGLLALGVQAGDKAAISKALKAGKVRAKGQGSGVSQI
jgi:hypothetical protein